MRVVSTLTAEASIALAKKLGPFSYFEENKDATCFAIESVARLSEERLNELHETGIRNSQLTTAQPSGTVSLILDCNSGIEPLFALKTTKNLAGGGTMTIVPKCIEEKYGKLVRMDESVAGILKTAHEISWEDHIKMVAALQQYISSGISKTINLPNDATVLDVEQAFLMAWRLGLKGVTVYRDGSKGMQPLTDAANKTEQKLEPEESPKWMAYRRKLPDTRRSITHKFNVSGFEGYVTIGFYPDTDEPGEIFIVTQKQGSTLAGLMDSFATSISLGLQFGVPLQAFVDKFKETRFEPAGWTINEDLKFATSVLDYIFKWLEKEFIDDETEEDIENQYSSIIPAPPKEINPLKPISFSGPPCTNCSAITVRNGSCFLCLACGSTSGCS
jgi:ribonucleoside-diphosphate reductase alpha chain